RECQSSLGEYPCASAATPAPLVIVTEYIIFKIDAVKRADFFALEAEGALLAVPYQLPFADGVHCTPSAFPAAVTMAAADAAHGDILDGPCISRHYMPLYVSAHDHSRHIVNKRSNSNPPQNFSCLDHNVIVAVKSVGYDNGRADREVIDAIDVSYFKIIQTFYPYSVGNERFGPGCFERVHYLSEKHRSDNPVSARRTEMCLDRNPFIRSEISRQRRLTEQPFQFSRH